MIGGLVGVLVRYPEISPTKQLRITRIADVFQLPSIGIVDKSAHGQRVRDCVRNIEEIFRLLDIEWGLSHSGLPVFSTSRGESGASSRPLRINGVIVY